MGRPAKDDGLPESPIPPYRRSAFVRATYRAMGLWAVAGAAAFAPAGWASSVSFLVGAAVACASFWLLEQILSWIYRPRKKRRRWVPVALIISKYGLLGVVLYYVVSGGKVRMAPFSVGVCVVFVAIISYVIYRETAAYVARARASRTA